MSTAKEVELATDLGLSNPLKPAPQIGEPQDGNARFLAATSASVAGHAGLFGTSQAVLELGQLWLKRVAIARDPLGRQMRQALVPRHDRLLGWFRLGEESYFHTGFAGSGVWVDPTQESVIAMVGHRIDPMRSLTDERAQFCQNAPSCTSVSSFGVQGSRTERTGGTPRVLLSASQSSVAD